jgi:hypothetical protein
LAAIAIVNARAIRVRQPLFVMQQVVPQEINIWEEMGHCEDEYQGSLVMETLSILLKLDIFPMIKPQFDGY